MGNRKVIFLNLCQNELKRNYGDKVVVFHFNVLQWSNQDLMSGFTKKFHESLIKATNSEELSLLVSRYIHLLKKLNVDLLGLSFKLDSLDMEFSDLYGKIGQLLRNNGKRIVIMIDDLDRLTADETYKILFTIKEAFNLPYVHYILCYDMENILGQKGNRYAAQKNVEFLEKFIQTKICLFVGKDSLIQAIDTNLGEITANLSDEVDLVAIKNALMGIKAILESDEAVNYQPYLGNIRQLKRLVNLILVLNIQRVDFQNYDFDPITLANLLLLYLNFPQMFRKIFTIETWLNSPSSEYLTIGYHRKKKLYINKIADENSEAYYLLSQIYGSLTTNKENDNEKKNTKNLLPYFDLIVKMKMG